MSGLIYTLSDGCDCICWLGFTCRKASNIESNRKNMILGRKACQSCLLIHQDFQYRTRQNFLEGIPGEKCSEKEEGMLAMLVFPLFFFSGTAQDLKGSVQVNIQGRVFISGAAPFSFRFFQANAFKTILFYSSCLMWNTFGGNTVSVGVNFARYDYQI